MILEKQTTAADFTKDFLEVINGSLKLTDKELELASIIIGMYLTYRGKMEEPFLSKYIFSTEGRKQICDTSGDLSAQNLGNKLKQLVDKRVLQVINGNYIINHKCLPQPEITFRFYVQ